MSGSLIFAENSERFFIGTYTKGDEASASRGIYSAALNLQNGAISDVNLVAEVSNPSFLAHHPTRDVLYAVVEAAEFKGDPGGGVVAFSRDADSPAWNILSEQSAGASGPCHLAIDPTGRVLITANYGGGSVSVFPIQPDGRLDHRSQPVQHTGSGPHPSRQKAPHAHGITFSPDGKWVFVPDLGLDQIKVYQVDVENARLVPGDPEAVHLAPGAGPRHFAFAPDGRHAYAINELDNTITAFQWNSSNGTFAMVDSVSTLPEDWTEPNTTAEIAIHPSGRFVVGSNRGHESLAVFERDSSTGRLTRLSVVPCGGKQPRSFSFSSDGRWIVVANQASNSLTTFAFDPTSGSVTQTENSASIGMPVCVLFSE